MTETELELEHLLEKYGAVEAKNVKNFIESTFDCSLEDMCRNAGNPAKCKVCRKPHAVGMDSWTAEEWDVCFECGYDRARKAMKTPAIYAEADLFMNFNYTEDEYKMLSSNSLYLWGPTGTGKTFLAFAIANYLLKMPGFKGASFIEFHDFVQRMRATYKPPRYLSEEQIMKKYIEAPLLILDDIFGSKEDDKPTELENHVLYQVVRERNHAKRRTIITGNYELRVLEESKGWNARTTSRMAELCISLKVDGPDRRLKEEEKSEVVG